MRKLTPEQEQVVAHPTGSHARVLAVAGSGKSTTLAYRIQHLIEAEAVFPPAIQVLMFNALARKQFVGHLEKAGLPQSLHPPVHTFHSFSYAVINAAIKASLLPANTQFWLSDKTEYVWVCLKRVINDLEKTKQILPESIDPEQAMQAISLWKASLISPEHAGSRAKPDLPKVYAGFEAFRQSQSALTYDDFIPLAIDLLENNPCLYRRYCLPIHYLITDEYQDVNFGQQTLIEMLAGEQADIMVVGDDDQTIYEWRGARPNYILTDFPQVFNNKPTLDYTLSRSFRFGPLIAQSAANVIACNSLRYPKPLVAFQVDKPGFIQLFPQAEDAAKELANQVQILLAHEQVPPDQIVVLARMYAQMGSLEAEFLERKIPYRVDGQEPIFKRKEISTLLDYIRLASTINEPMTEEAAQWLLNIANKPSRYLSRSLLDRLVSTARSKRLSPKVMLEQLASDPSFGLRGWQARPIYKFLDVLVDLKEGLNQPEASEVLSWLVSRLDYLAFFQEYYGSGETADEKANSVTRFIDYVQLLHVTPLKLLDELQKLDTTQGRPEAEQILFTTIFRTKGLEFDYVLIPECDEGMLPYRKGEAFDILDTSGHSHSPALSNVIENERRLFYVGITRARKGVLIGTAGNPSRFLEEIRLANTISALSPTQQFEG